MSTNSISRWTDDRPEQAYHLALLGATNKDMAVVFGCDVQTVDYWMRTKKFFRDAVNKGKMVADANVAASFYKSCVGYDVKEKKAIIAGGKVQIVEVTRHVPGNPWAQKQWLTARQREKWAEVSRTEITQTNVNINKFDFTGLSTEELELIKKMGMKQLEAHVSNN